MSDYKTHAVVLRAREHREADRMVTLLTREDGKVTIIAKGVRKASSRFKAVVQPITLGFFLLHRGKSLDTLIQGEIIKPYMKVQSDLVSLSFAQYFCELCEASLPEREPAPQMFELLLTGLEHLESDSSSARVACCFELNLLELLGYRPQLESCQSCGNKKGFFNFSPQLDGIVCQLCPDAKKGFPVSGAAVATMRHFLDNGFYRLSVCTVPAALCKEIMHISGILLSKVTGRSHFKALDVLQSFDELK